MLETLKNMKLIGKQYCLQVITLLCVAGASSAFAVSGINNDANPPFWRGAAESTVAKWGFDTTNVQNALIPPEAFVNPYVIGLASNSLNAVEKQGSLGKPWKDVDATWSATGNLPQGCWILGKGTMSAGSLAFSITNNPAAPVGTYQYIQVADTWYAGVVKEPTNMLYLQGTLVNSNQTTTGAQDSSGNNWYLTKTIWRLPVYAASTAFKLIANGASGSTLDAVIVDIINVHPAFPPNLAQFADQGRASKSNVVYDLGSASPAITNITCSPPSGSTFALGSSMVSCTNIDFYGYATVASFSVAILLPPAPQFTQCAANQTNALGSACQIAIPDLTGGIIATGLNRTLSQSPAATTQVGPGQHTVTFTVWNDGGTNTCTALFVVTGSAPVAVNDPLDATAGAASTMTAAKLLINDSHPDGRAMQVVGVTSPSAQNGTVTFDGTSIVYTPASGYTGLDSFTYTNRDCAGLFSTALVQINVTSATNFLNLVSIKSETIGSDQVVTVVAQGIANYSYTLVRATQLSEYSSNWVKVATTKASSNAVDYGQIIYRDTNPPAPSFYRTKYPPMP